MSTQTGHVAPVTAAAAMPTGAVSAAARWATARAVAGTTAPGALGGNAEADGGGHQAGELDRRGDVLPVAGDHDDRRDEHERAAGRRQPGRDRLGASASATR